ncbi:hypothetical protein D9V32_04635 [Mycetocola tolaasinivorans]|uniref:Aldose 1-epimerase n=1 Tax=Mycetocola tolaasinivorans TaxID=76635 RepID=A0A3L7AB76_9MICO|nr:hypothetical protein D9V32_04635 [Mycetocola tolaasinivorans]
MRETPAHLAALVPAALGHLALTGTALTASVDPVGARLDSLVFSRGDREPVEVLFRREAEPDREEDAPGSNGQWHRRYLGGWHTLVPHSGDERVVDGIAQPFHGEAAWRTWEVLSVSPASVRLGLTLDSVPIRLEREFGITGSTLVITQRVNSLGVRPQPISWAEHPAFAPPLVGPGLTVTLGDTPLPLHIPAPPAAHGAFAAYATGGRGIAELDNPEAGLRATLTWDAELFPYAFVWQEHRLSQGSPWHGHTDVLALEPSVRPYDPEDERLGPLVIQLGETVETTFALSLN